MDIGLREWLVIIGIIVIAAILFDGWRRIRGSRSKLRLDKSIGQFYDDSDDFSLAAAKVSKPNDITFSAGAQTDTETPLLSAKQPATKREEPQISLNLSEQEIANNANKAKNSPEAAQESPKQIAIEEVLVINVISNHPDGFKGPALLQNILESGLRFGEMDIFHRHESMTGNGERYFSMANGVKPGTFDLDDIDHFSTRAVSFFLGLPGPKHPKRAFDVMLAAARKLSNELDGRLQDDQRSVITAQTIEHYRQRIADFERRRMTIKK